MKYGTSPSNHKFLIPFHNFSLDENFENDGIKNLLKIAPESLKISIDS
jgi:hypothetical protein